MYSNTCRNLVRWLVKFSKNRVINHNLGLVTDPCATVIKPLGTIPANKTNAIQELCTPRISTGFHGVSPDSGVK